MAGLSRNTGLRSAPFHVALFCVYPVLALLGVNTSEMTPAEALWPLGIAAAVGLALVAACVILRCPARICIALSLAVILVLSYGHGRRLLGNALATEPGEGSQDAFFWIWLAATVVAVAVVIVSVRSGRRITSLLNTVGAALVAVGACTFVMGATRQSSVSVTSSGDEPLDSTITAASTGPRPDIYYIIFDRYGNERVLSDTYGCDNSEIGRWLRERGFSVSTRSHANYLKTAVSLASSLNYEYLDDLRLPGDQECTNWVLAQKKIKNHRVSRFLKARGYRYYHFGSWWNGTQRNEHADVNVNPVAANEFTVLLWKTMLLHPLFIHSGTVSRIVGVRGREQDYQRVVLALEQLQRLPEAPEPTFAFVHLLAPHPPYVFDRNGKFLSYRQSRKRGDSLNYVEQVMFVNSRIRALVDTLLLRSPTPPVIILQADEGPFPRRYQKDQKGFRWTAATRRELQQKMGIFYAAYLPGDTAAAVYEGITPVNTFRVVFNRYFDAGLPLLPDTSFAFPDAQHLYSFYSVNDSLGYDGR